MKSVVAQPEPIPSAALQIVQAAIRDGCTLNELSVLAHGDPAFAMRLLALVNSPVYRLSRSVGGVAHGINLLGLRGVRNLALSLVFTDMAPPSPEGDLLLTNCLRRAVAADTLGRALEIAETDSCFTAGLLLEGAFLVWMCTDPETAAATGLSPSEHRILLERSRGRRPHPEMGAELAASYGLPSEIQRAIRLHHGPTPPKRELARVCWLAEHYAAVYEGGDVRAQTERTLEQAASFGLNRERAYDLLREIPSALQTACAAFQRAECEQIDLDVLVADAHLSLARLNTEYEQLVRHLQTVIAEKEALAVELAQQATTDALTGLANRRALDGELAREVARAAREGSPLAVVVLDVDHFKRFNDSHGHAVGDEVLRSVGACLGECIRASDIAARSGGEEFVLMLPSTDVAGARVVAERCRVAIAGIVVRVDGKALRVTASAGVAAAHYGPGEQGADALLEAADRALYVAKNDGRNCVRAA